MGRSRGGRSSSREIWGGRERQETTIRIPLKSRLLRSAASGKHRQAKIAPGIIPVTEGSTSLSAPMPENTQALRMNAPKIKKGGQDLKGVYYICDETKRERR